MKRFLLISTLILSVASSSPAKGPKFNVDFDVGWGGCYRPMEWTPVEIGITANIKKPFDGVLTVSAEQDNMTRMTVAHEFVLTPDLPLPVPLVTKFAFAADSCEVRIGKKRGSTVWWREYKLWDRGSGTGKRLTAVGEDDLFIGLVGRRVFGLPHLPRYTACRSNDTSGKVYLKQKTPRMLPRDWTGYRSLDLLVLYDPDWNLINAHQADAIAQWVGNGGKLLVVLGGRTLPKSHPIAKLLPFEFGERKQMPVSPIMLSDWGCSATAPAVVACLPVKPKPDARLCETKMLGTDEAVFATGFVGFGRVGVLSFDPSGLEVRQPKYAARFWARRFGSLLGSSADKAGLRTIKFDTDGGASESDDYYSGYETGLAGRGANAVLEHLLHIPELKPLSIWWVVGLLALLAVLLGPVDYFVLKGLDRQPMTWVTSAVCIGLFTVGAWYGVQELRSGETQLRVVSVVDAIEGGRGAWSTTYAGLFAPKSDDYKLANLQPNQWWSGVVPVGGYLYAYGRETAGRKIYCSQHDGSNLPYSLPINIWSMQCLMCESAVGPVPVTATVERTGRKVAVHIVNRSDRPVRTGYIRFSGDMIMDFGGVPAGESKDFSGNMSSGGEWEKSLDDSDDYDYGGWGGYEYGTTSFSKARNTAYFAYGCLRRTRAIEAYLARGAAVVCLEYNHSEASFGVADRRCKTDHVQLVRLVVFPKEE